MKQIVPILLLMANAINGLDLVFDRIQCDTSLPAYVEEDGIIMKCNGEQRCSLGEQSMISGELIYQGLDTFGLNGTMGYVSAKLQLMTMEYNLFSFLPFNFCGEWIMNAAYNYQECPSDGVYHFEVPYKLPESQGISTWFASGWEGVSYLKIYKAQKDTSAMLAHCKIHFKTYVTDTGESNWYTLPSAAQTTIILFGVLGALFLLVLCLACRPRRRHPTDDDYDSHFKEFEDDEEPDKVVAERDVEDTKPTVETENEIEEKARKISLQMNYQAPVEK